MLCIIQISCFFVSIDKCTIVKLFDTGCMYVSNSFYLFIQSFLDERQSFMIHALRHNNIFYQIVSTQKIKNNRHHPVRTGSKK